MCVSSSPLRWKTPHEGKLEKLRPQRRGFRFYLPRSIAAAVYWFNDVNCRYFVFMGGWWAAMGLVIRAQTTSVRLKHTCYSWQGPPRLCSIHFAIVNQINILIRPTRSKIINKSVRISPSSKYGVFTHTEFMVYASSPQKCFWGDAGDDYFCSFIFC